MKKQMDFIMEADKMKNIGRQTYIADGSRKENDAEHSWSLALMCMLMAEHANSEINLLRTMQMVLVHDLVEIDAGDMIQREMLQKENGRLLLHRGFFIFCHRTRQNFYGNYGMNLKKEKQPRPNLQILWIRFSR